MFLEFVAESWYLFAMLAFIIVLLVLDPTNRGAGGAKTLAPAQLPQIQAREKAVIVDLSDDSRFKEGHIAQSINVPFSQLEERIPKIRKYRDKPVILACENGNNSRKASGILKKNEFKVLYMLQGGLAAWRKENFPLEKG